MSDAWQQLQAMKSKQNSYRERLEKRKKERQDILGASLGVPLNAEGSPGTIRTERSVPSPCTLRNENSDSQSKFEEMVETEHGLLRVLSNLTLQLPITCKEISALVGKDVNPNTVASLLHKFAAQLLIVVKETLKDPTSQAQLEVQSIEHVKLAAMVHEMGLESSEKSSSKNLDENTSSRKRKGDDESEIASSKVSKSGNEKDDKKSKKGEPDILSLLSMPSSREKENKKMGEEILDLLSKPTAKERSLAEKFKSQGGTQVKEYCQYGTRAECIRIYNVNKQANNSNSSETGTNNQQTTPNEKDNKDTTQVKSESNNLANGTGYSCEKLHFKKIIQLHTDESLGDCSFLNTCFHMDTCKYVHYKVDGAVSQSKDSDNNSSNGNSSSCKTMQSLNAASGAQNGSNSRLSGSSTLSRVSGMSVGPSDSTTLYPPQWVQCDLRFLDMTVLGKFAVIMADPPWDIHMELPYGTMSDDEMRQLGVPQLQDQGLIFLWVTGRAMELGRECLKLWGYERVDELIWVKTNQLQRIIRTGRTGHWLNHGKEHCLVGMKGRPLNLNRGLDCDVIVAEVRATSHKPDEIYGIIERLSPGTRKIELFGRPHNVQPNWITLGNQVDGVRLVDPELIQAFQKRYPDGNCMTPKPDVSLNFPDKNVL
ncbi:methyltransferase like 3 [Arctopsyche grandis]|uniref:methyltransferase like 3 n=1 Tax=Arctopsyche grandis TaxID=121162 RepID=UPI00406D7B61